MEKGSNVDLLDIASANIAEQANNCLSCPPLLLQVIRDVSLSSGIPKPGDMPAKETDQLL